jgi:hypothetical protein
MLATMILPRAYASGTNEGPRRGGEFPLADPSNHVFPSSECSSGVLPGLFITLSKGTQSSGELFRLGVMVLTFHQNLCDCFRFGPTSTAMRVDGFVHRAKCSRHQYTLWYSPMCRDISYRMKDWS